MIEGEVIERRPVAVRLSESRAQRLAALARRHLALLLLLAVAAALRAVALVAVYPGIWFSDTNSYLEAATTGILSVVRVDGYALFVAPFVQVGSAPALIVTQHVLGLVIVVALYALLLRRGVSRLLAFLAVLPAALDGYLISLEHMIMSETVFHAAVVGAATVLLWRERPTVSQAAAAGVLLGYAGVVRSVAIPFIALFVIYLLLRRVGAYPLLAFCLGWAVIVGAYVTVYRVQHGEFALTGWEGRFLYAKVAPFADCAELPDVPADQRDLCPDPEARLAPNSYLWSARSPIRYLPLSADPRIRDFALRVIEHEPGSYVRVVTGDLLHYFEPGRRKGRGDYDFRAWQFPKDPRRWGYPGYRGPIRPAAAVQRRVIDPGPYVNAVVDRPSTNVSASRFLHYYQRYFYTSGQVLAGCVLLVLLGLVPRPRHGWSLRLDAALLGGSALTSLVVAAALSVFDYRYGLLAVLLLPPAAALAGTGMLQGRGRAGRPDEAPSALG